MSLELPRIGSVAFAGWLCTSGCALDWNQRTAGGEFLPDGGKADSGTDADLAPEEDGSLPTSCDRDGDGFCDGVDNCPDAPNPLQENIDGDERGDLCDKCPSDPQNDVDGDAVCGDLDNCPSVGNPTQTDADGDATGDLCDECLGGDLDFDGACDALDNCPAVWNPTQADLDGDGIGWHCDPQVVLPASLTSSWNPEDIRYFLLGHNTAYVESVKTLEGCVGEPIECDWYTRSVVSWRGIPVSQTRQGLGAYGGVWMDGFSTVEQFFTPSSDGMTLSRMVFDYDTTEPELGPLPLEHKESVLELLSSYYELSGDRGLLALYSDDSTQRMKLILRALPAADQVLFENISNLRVVHDLVYFVDDTGASHAYELRESMPPRRIDGDWAGLDEVSSHYACLRAASNDQVLLIGSDDSPGEYRIATTATCEAVAVTREEGFEPLWISAPDGVHRAHAGALVKVHDGSLGRVAKAVTTSTDTYVILANTTAGPFDSVLTRLVGTGLQHVVDLQNVPVTSRTRQQLNRMPSFTARALANGHLLMFGHRHGSSSSLVEVDGVTGVIANVSLNDVRRYQVMADGSVFYEVANDSNTVVWRYQSGATARAVATAPEGKDALLPLPGGDTAIAAIENRLYWIDDQVGPLYPDWSAPAATTISGLSFLADAEGNTWFMAQVNDSPRIFVHRVMGAFVDVMAGPPSSQPQYIRTSRDPQGHTWLAMYRATSDVGNYVLSDRAAFVLQTSDLGRGFGMADFFMDDKLISLDTSRYVLFGQWPTQSVFELRDETMAFVGTGQVHFNGTQQALWLVPNTGPGKFCAWLDGCMDVEPLASGSRPTAAIMQETRALLYDSSVGRWILVRSQ